MKITKETDVDKVDDIYDNNLVITPPFKFIFNNYKTFKNTDKKCQPEYGEYLKQSYYQVYPSL